MRPSCNVTLPPPPPVLTTIDSAFVPEALSVSVAFAVKLEVPAVVGVPVMAPVDELRLKPAGRLPDSSDHASAPVPPVAIIVWLYAVPTVPPGRLDVVIEGVAFITMLSALVPVALTVSVAIAVKLEVPETVGVPVMAPVEELSDSPVGSVPLEIDHVGAPVPPVAVSVWLYATLTVSAGRLAVVIVTAALTTMDKAFVAVAPTLSVTLAVKLDVPDVVGVPVIAPVEATMESPAGRLPEEIDHERGEVPPVEARVWLYVAPTVVAGRLDVVIEGAALTTMESAFVALAVSVSVALTVKLEVPDAVGVPVIDPPEVRDSPVGRLPALRDQVRAPVPPVAASAWL